MEIKDEQASIVDRLGVAPIFDAHLEIENRPQFLSNYLMSSNMRAYVLGISGGVDSLLAGLLAQRAVRHVRELGHEAEFIAVRIPYGTQIDERDAQIAIATLDPDRTLTIKIKSATDAIFFNLHHARG